MHKTFSVAAASILWASATLNPLAATASDRIEGTPLPVVIGSHQSRAKSSATTDVSDLWWNSNESGWGVQLVQNNDFVFATLFVYGSTGTPTWFSAQLNNVGEFTWSGPLYATAGPSFGAASFDPRAVAVRQVGSATFELTTVADGVLTYSVNGVNVRKSITRQTLVNEDVSGTYDVVRTQSSVCRPPLGSGGGPSLRSLTLTQSGNSVVGQQISSVATCNFVGAYTQYGKLGDISGNFTCSSGEVGTFQFFEIQVTETGLIARLQEQSNFCTYTGQFAGNRR